MERESFDFNDHEKYTMNRVQALFDVCKQWDTEDYEFRLVIHLFFMRDDTENAKGFYIDLLKIIKHYNYPVRLVLRALNFWRVHATCSDIMGSAKCRSCGNAYPIDMLDSFHHGTNCPPAMRERKHNATLSFNQ